MGKSRQRNGRKESSHLLPTARTRVADQLKTMVAAGRYRGFFTSRQLAVPGVSDHRKGLVTSFLCACGLLNRGGGRGVFRATPAARVIAEAWGRSESLGRRELAAVLEATWFAECVRQELERHGKCGAARAALAEHLRVSAGAPENRHREVQILISWLLEARLLRPLREGYLGWNGVAGAHEAAQAASRGRPKGEVAGADGSQGAVDSSEASLCGGALTPDRVSLVPSCALPAQTACSSGIRKLINFGPLGEVAAGPFYLRDLLQLSEEELLSLHRGLRLLAGVGVGS
ncbi:hypothetical protein ACFYPK_31880 [Streptomyces halstedii]|uniref:hypothetical protein n=1 Tax=Streptomyces halstedii TaxID=1944 RepID=UPI0034611A46